MRYVLGRYREALAEFETSAALAAEADRAVQASIEHVLADVHHRLGDWNLAEAHLAVVAETGRGHAASNRVVVATTSSGARRCGNDVVANWTQRPVDSARAASTRG